MAKHRIYRLGALLKHGGACSEWQWFVARFRTADEVIAAVNSDPARYISPNSQAADNVRWFARSLSAYLGDSKEECWWMSARALSSPFKPLTRVERDRFRALWVRYADKHGLFEEAES